MGPKSRWKRSAATLFAAGWSVDGGMGARCVGLAKVRGIVSVRTKDWPRGRRLATGHATLSQGERMSSHTTAETVCRVLTPHANGC